MRCLKTMIKSRGDCRTKCQIKTYLLMLIVLLYRPMMRHVQTGTIHPESAETIQEEIWLTEHGLTSSSSQNICLVKRIGTSPPPSQQQTQSHCFEYSADSSHSHSVQRSLLCKYLADELFFCQGMEVVSKRRP